MLRLHSYRKDSISTHVERPGEDHVGDERDQVGEHPHQEEPPVRQDVPHGLGRVARNDQLGEDVELGERDRAPTRADQSCPIFLKRSAG